MSTPTQDIDESSRRIESKHELVEHLERGSKPADQWRIGTEHEKFGFRISDKAPLPYEGDTSIKALLEALATEHNWQPILEAGHLIGLKKNGASVSLEPGGQFELSGAPLETVHQTCAEIDNHQRELGPITERLGIAFLALGSSPIWSLAETPVMPKGRYGIMSRYMQKVGRLGREMMFRTCTVQSNLDFSSEADMVAKMRVALALQPVVTALFANSPFTENRLNGYQSYRAHIWSDTDPDRTGMLPFAFEEGFGFEQYVDYALDVPMYFVRRHGEYIDCAGQSFRKFMEGKLEALPGERPAMDDFDDHLSTIFPEVRLKTFLEMRGADSGPKPSLCALSAVWAGLLYDSTALDQAWQLAKSWTEPQRDAFRRSAPALGLSAPIADRNAQEVARDMLAISRAGLNRRAKLNESGDTEAHFINDLEVVAETGVNSAQKLISRYHNDWAGNLDAVFTDSLF